MEQWQEPNTRAQGLLAVTSLGTKLVKMSPTSDHQAIPALLAPGQLRLKKKADIPPTAFQKVEKHPNPLANATPNSCEDWQQGSGQKPHPWLGGSIR